MQNTLFHANSSTCKHPNGLLSPEHRPTHPSASSTADTHTATLQPMCAKRKGANREKRNLRSFLRDLLPRNITTVVTNKDRGVAQNNIATDYSYGLHLMQVEEGGKLNRRPPTVSLCLCSISLRCYGMEMLQCTLHLTLQINGTG